MKIKAVIFDMDGVLIEAKDWHYEALNMALALFGYEISRSDHLSSYDGLPTKVKLAKLTAEKGLPQYLHSFISEMKQVYTMEMVAKFCKPRFAHEYALSRLKNEGYLLAVASNSVRNTIDEMMERAALMPYLNFFLSNEDVTHSKPHPEMYSTAIERLGLSPKDCLVVEDNENGIKAAEAAGAHLLVVRGIEDVSYDNIATRIAQLEGAKA